MSTRPERITLQNFGQFSCEIRGGWTLVQLKRFCDDLSLSHVGSKVEVTARIYHHLRIPQNGDSAPTLAREAAPIPKPATTLSQPASNLCQEFKQKRFSPEEIEQRRVLIRQCLGMFPNGILTMTEQQFILLFQLYDHYFFQSQLTAHFNSSTDQIRFKFGMSASVAGSYGWEKKDQIIYRTLTLSKAVLGGIFGEGSSKVETANGLQVTDQLGATMIILEHELVHMAVQIWASEEIKVGKRRQVHGPLFQTLVRNIFGHTDFRHSIGQGLSEDPEIYMIKVKRYLNPGMIAHVYDHRVNGTIAYKVTAVNIKRFRGVSQSDGREYDVPLINVVLPEEKE